MTNLVRDELMGQLPPFLTTLPQKSWSSDEELGLEGAEVLLRSTCSCLTTNLHLHWVLILVTKSFDWQLIDKWTVDNLLDIRTGTTRSKLLRNWFWTKLLWAIIARPVSTPNKGFWDVNLLDRWTMRWFLPSPLQWGSEWRWLVNVSVLKSCWLAEFEKWCREDIKSEVYVYQVVQFHQ